MKKITFYYKVVLLFIALSIANLLLEEYVKNTKWFNQMIAIPKFIFENLTILFLIFYMAYFIWRIEKKIAIIQMNGFTEYPKNSNLDENEKLRISIELVRFTNFKSVESNLKYNDGAINSFLALLSEEKAKVKDILVKKFDFKTSDANDLVENYYKKYPI
jgi:hypothetical protein